MKMRSVAGALRHMLTYVFHVQRKDGVCDTGLDFYRGDMPRAGEIVQVVVRGEML
jgi:hypothetical protein